jgi:hypothetical protein
LKEAQGVYPFLRPAFAKGGVLEGKVVEGDTIRFTFINPEDDPHSFVLPDFAVSLPGGQATEATYVAKHAADELGQGRPRRNHSPLSKPLDCLNPSNHF